MSKLTCNCLNVSLNIKEDGCEVTEGIKLLEQDSEDKKNLDCFFQRDVIIVSLAVAGIEVQQKLLIKEREVNDYKVFKCINCDMSTHAIHKFKGLERVVASKEMTDASTFIRLRDSPDYSPVFKIVLKQIQDVNDNNDAHQAKMFHKSLSDANSKVQEIVKRFLVVEEGAMKERIRIFTEQQQSLFNQLQTKIIADKGMFLRLISKKEENALQSSLDDAMSESVLSKTNSVDSESEDQAPDLPQIKGRKMRPNRFALNSAAHDSSSSSRAPSRVLASQENSKRSSSNGHRITKPVSTSRGKSWKSHTEDDVLFDLDGFHESKSCEPFFESDEESSDSNSLDSSGGYTIPNRGSAGDRIYATSVPVGIPMYRPPNRESFESTEEMDMNAPPSPGKIAESMKALARSLHDSTSIFGDLPTPRYNTMPYK